MTFVWPEPKDSADVYVTANIGLSGEPGPGDAIDYVTVNTTLSEESSLGSANSYVQVAVTLEPIRPAFDYLSMRVLTTDGLPEDPEPPEDSYIYGLWKVWDGEAYRVGVAKAWNGETWKEIVKVWDGSKWVLSASNYEPPSLPPLRISSAGVDVLKKLSPSGELLVSSTGVNVLKKLSPDGTLRVGSAGVDILRLS